MKIKRVFAVYFSPTGGTEKVTQAVAQAAARVLCAKYNEISFTLPEERLTANTFNEDDLVVLGTPVIAGRVPNVLLPYLNEKLIGNGAYGVPVVSFGNRSYDDALIELRNIMEDKGFRTVGGGGFVSEHSFSRTLGAGRPDDEDLEMLKEFGEKIGKKLLSDWIYDGPAYVKGETPLRPYYTPRDRHGAGIDIRKVKPKTGEGCCSCGICAAVCPMGSIPKDDPTAVTGICIKCCACVKKCPTGVKYFDDPGFIYHKEELEEIYHKRARAEYFC